MSRLSAHSSRSFRDGWLAPAWPASRNDASTRIATKASIHKDIPIDAAADDVWAAVRDFGAVHLRLAPGFVVDTRLDGNARIVTFHNGTVARELLIDCDDRRRRLAYAIVGERVRHYSASIQVAAEGARTRMTWTVDVLPNEIAPYISDQMDQGVLAMQNALGRGAMSPATM